MTVLPLALALSFVAVQPSTADHEPLLPGHVAQLGDPVDDIGPDEPTAPSLQFVDLDDPNAPLTVHFSDEERLARPMSFSVNGSALIDLVVFRSGRQIYLHLAAEPGESFIDDADATYWEHETDAGLGDGIRRALTQRGASPDAAEAVASALQPLLERPYRWQALCFMLEGADVGFTAIGLPR